MQHEPGDEYIRRFASYIRDNEVRLAQAGLGRRRKAHSVPNTSIFNPLGWVGIADGNPPKAPLVLSIDAHRLFYLLMRMEALSIDVGSLDVQVDDLTRPLSYIHFDIGKDKSDTLSIAESLRSSLTAVSKLSLGSGWWGKTEVRPVESELKYIYSSFTKLPALSLGPPGPKMIAELAQDPPLTNAIPLDSFKTLSSLECVDVDPRAILGWDMLAESLRSLTIRRGGLEDPKDVFIDAVIDDQMRRQGDATRSRIRKLGHRASAREFHSSNLPETVQEESEDELSDESPAVATAMTQLSPLKWAFLKHLSLSENALTSIPTSMLPALTSLTHLDLSSNLLVSIPQLSALYNLQSLNLADNMIDSVLGIYTKLGQVLVLNLARNRLESICGLERLMALERIDLRHNTINDSAEVGRLAVLPNINEVWIEGNHFAEIEENYRVKCFEHFWKEGKTISLDGSLPGFYERRARNGSSEVSTPRVPAAPYSPPFTPVNGPIANIPSTKQQTQQAADALSSGPSSLIPSPNLGAVIAKPKKKRNKRIVNLNGDGTESDFRSSEDGGYLQPILFDEPSRVRSTSPSVSSTSSPPKAKSKAKSSANGVGKRSSRHGRRRTEYDQSSPISPTQIAQRSTSLDRSPQSPHSPQSTSPARAGRRRSRQAASSFEPSPRQLQQAREGAEAQLKDGDAFRARIEALREEMGDNWLQVLSQTQFEAGRR